MKKKLLKEKIIDHPPKLPHFEFIDALRGIAILGVLLAHTATFSTIHYPSWLQLITQIELGPRGVQLFYIVSAYTLCLTFTKRYGKESHPIRNFYLRRFFRIAPVFYLAIIYYLWQNNFWNGNPSHYSITGILSTFTFTNGFSPLWINGIVYGGWSIAVETSFYAIFPLLMSRIKNLRTALITTVVVSVVIQIMRLYLLSLPSVIHTPDLQTFTFQFFPSQLPVFLIGITVFFLGEKNYFQYKKHIGITILIFLLLLIVQHLTGIKIIAGHYIYGIIFGVVLLLLSRYNLRVLVNTFTVYLGKISFSLYLCHIGTYYWLEKAGLTHILPTNPYLNFLLRFIVVSGTASVVATILYYTVEKAGIALGKKIIAKDEQRVIIPSEKTW